MRCLALLPAAEPPKKLHRKRVKVLVDFTLKAHARRPDGGPALEGRNCFRERAAEVYARDCREPGMEIPRKGASRSASMHARLMRNPNDCQR